MPSSRSSSAMRASRPATADSRAFNFSAFANKQENYYPNVAGPVWPIWSYGGRLKLRWDITDHLSNTFTGFYQQVSDNAGLSLTEPAGLLPSSLPRITLPRAAISAPMTRCSRTSGVWPMASSRVMYVGMGAFFRQSS